MDDLDLPSVEDSGDFGVSVPEEGPDEGVIVPFMPLMTPSATCLASACRLGMVKGGWKTLVTSSQKR